MELHIRNPKSRNDWKHGDTAYCYSNRAQKIMPVTVITALVCSASVKISTFGRITVPMCALFETHAEAVAAYDNYCVTQKNEYRSQITDVNSLVKFGLLHRIARTPSETDWLAREIYIEKAMELLGLDLSGVDPTQDDSQEEED